MSLTPNYGFNIPTGSDAVNLLTQCYPNFTSLDSILKTIELTGITTATVSKVGTVFQLVRTNSSLNIIKFIATGNYQAGDTFTVDGVSVTATAVDGTSLQSGSFVINQSVIAILNGSVLTVLVQGGGSINASDVTYDNTGSSLTAANVQDAIDEVENNVSTGLSNVHSELTSLLTGTIAAGSTTVTITDVSILTTSIIDIYFQDKLLAPTNVTVTTGAITIEIDAQDSATYVGVRVLNA